MNTKYDIVSMQTWYVGISDKNSAFQPLNVCVRYNKNDPYAICITFGISDEQDEDDNVTWYLSRDMFRAAWACRLGEGDVVIDPDTTVSRYCSVIKGKQMFGLTLRNDLGESSDFAIPRYAFKKFLNATFKLVSSGDEHLYMDLDSKIMELMNSES